MLKKHLFNSILIVISIFLIGVFTSCNDDEGGEMENQTCLRCTYKNNLPSQCDSTYIKEACVIGNRPNSLQVIMEIKEYCGNNIKTSEETGFLEDFQAISESEGAECEEF